jgi:hypothetical protein
LRLLQFEYGIGLALEECHADHADVVRTPSTRRVGVPQIGEVERRNFVQALAPTLDRQCAAPLDHVAALRRGGSLASDDIDAVHRHHREQVAPSAVANRDLVLVAGFAGDEPAAAALVDRQHAAAGAIVDLHIGEVAGRQSWGNRQEKTQKRQEASHGVLH